jgi:hypothetical protein
MENPYWHPEGKNHVVNGDEVRGLVFDIFNIVRASMALMVDAGDKDEFDDVQPTSVEQVQFLEAVVDLMQLAEDLQS